jgi:nicotinamide mononucleotide adenylyltransferase
MHMTKQPRPCEVGVIHGRFQVLHNDHLRYLLAGAALCRHLVVGITNPDPWSTRPDSADPGRSDPLANPLTYYERYRMLRAVLEARGLAAESLSVVPLPINLPERYRFYVPLNAVFFLSITDDWGRRKRAYFQSLGLKIHVLREVPAAQKGISAKTIREAMIQGRPWTHLVPPETAALMKKWRIAARLKKCREEG